MTDLFFLKFGLEFIVELVVCIVLMLIGQFVINKIRNNPNSALNPHEYLPDDEIHTLKQVFYLIMMSIIFVDMLYSMIYYKGDILYLAVLDIVLCLYIAVTFDKNSWKNKILIFLLLPFGSMTYVIFNFSYLSFFDIVHVPILGYFIIVYYRKFREYTENNGLGLTILLLFIIIFASVFFTMGVEDKNPLDALVMVSNAFTSNGYAILGNTIVGKLNSLLLVWGGYVISGAGTATLTAAILLRHFNKRIRRLEDLINEEGLEK